MIEPDASASCSPIILWSICRLDVLFTKMLWEIVSKAFIKSQTPMFAFPFSVSNHLFSETTEFVIRIHKLPNRLKACSLCSGFERHFEPHQMVGNWGYLLHWNLWLLTYLHENTSWSFCPFFQISQEYVGRNEKGFIV